MSEDISLKILEDREKRSEFINNCLNEYSVCTIKANYPSEDKNNYIAWALVGIFEKVFENNIDGLFEIADKLILDGFDGRCIVYSFDKKYDCNILKNIGINIEENHELGRYIDIDVYDYDTKKALSRGLLRKCILCDDYAIVCARNKKHDINEIIDKIEFDVKRFLEIEVKKLINYSCMVELNLKYKFGLVTPYHPHKDMDYNLMVKAYQTLIYPFLEMFSLGFELDNLEELNKHLHLEGKRAEYLMYKETKGVNCYKGLIFLLGMFLGGLGYSIKNQRFLKEVLKELNKDVLSEYEDETIQTFGAKSYREYGFLGARGEAYNGFINVFKNCDELNNYSDLELYRLLINLVRDVDDTVLLKRSGSMEKYKYYKNLISNVNYNDLEDIQIKTLECERNDISIGGCADIFVITVFFSLFKKNFRIEGLF